MITGDSTVADEIKVIYDKISLEDLFFLSGGKREIEFVKELPKTISGKIKRKELRTMEFERKRAVIEKLKEKGFWQGGRVLFIPLKRGSASRGRLVGYLFNHHPSQIFLPPISLLTFD